MLHVDEHPETLHIYVVREEAPRPQLYPVFFSVLALACLVALAVAVPYQQPVTRAVIRVPAALLPPKTFTAQVAIIPTGIKVYPVTTAHGTLTITNGSVIAQVIPAGFIVQNVATDRAVYVPAGSANGYGYAIVPAHALTGGRSGNIPANTINQVEGSSVFIRNFTAFHGGQDSYSIKFVTNTDRSAAITSARNALLRISLGLHYPCVEVRSVNKAAVRVSWRCKYITHNLPSYMHVSNVRIIGKNLLITATYTPRLVRVGLK